MELLIGKARQPLFIALGGGGDVASASMLALAARRLGLKAYVASVVWERFSIDPVPGPVRMSEIVNAKKIGDHAMFVTEESKALRGDRVVAFQAANASRALGEPIGVVDIASGYIGVRRGIEELTSYLGCDVVVGVDVGGDVLATGFEEELWSPLADFIGLAAIKDLKGVLAVHAPGSDGELTPRYILKRIALVAAHGGYLGARGITPEDVENLDKLLRHVESEASRVTLMAARGAYGQVKIRRGSRKVQITPLSTITFFLKPETVACLNPLISEVYNTTYVEEAREKLNRKGVYTELDLEEDVYQAIKEGREISGETLIEIKKNKIIKVLRRE
ncbi:MAG: DUF1152 domain-containing protein [Candidatus Nezhaarchaeales archaeon]